MFTITLTLLVVAVIAILVAKARTSATTTVATTAIPAVPTEVVETLHAEAWRAWDELSAAATSLGGVIAATRWAWLHETELQEALVRAHQGHNLEMAIEGRIRLLHAADYLTRLGHDTCDLRRVSYCGTTRVGARTPHGWIVSFGDSAATLPHGEVQDLGVYSGLDLRRWSQRWDHTYTHF